MMNIGYDGLMGIVYVSLLCECLYWFEMLVGFVGF